MHVVLRYVDKGGKALAEPHGDISVHVDTEGLKAFLETTHGVVLKSAGVLAQVHMSDLRHAHTAHWDETWWTVEGHWWVGQANIGLYWFKCELSSNHAIPCYNVRSLSF